MSRSERPLSTDDVDPDPFVQFGRWFDDAATGGALQPEAMTVATATPDGRPSARLVLLRGVDARGFVFYTNTASRKGRELDANPHAAVVLHWPELARQVRATGRVELIDDAESDAYWATRPRGSQISAVASDQSLAVASRDELESRVAALEERFEGVDVPRPEHWGGFRVMPEEIEFWQHRDDRLHDRVRYRLVGPDDWVVERLQP